VRDAVTTIVSAEGASFSAANAGAVERRAIARESVEIFIVGILL
jgi:hypothetical protein